RFGKVDTEVKKFLNSHTTKKKMDPNIPRILSRNWEVDKYNDQKLKELTTPAVNFKTQYAGEEWAIKRIKENLVVGEVLTLKKGALVMMRINNFKEGYINGTVGVIQGLTDDVLTIKKLNGEII